jgi:hypothetical protein
MAKRQSTEIWADIPDFPGYQASTLGRIRSFWKFRFEIGTGRKGRISCIGTEPKILKPARSKAGYLKVKLTQSGKIVTRMVHQLVLFTFHGPRPFPKAVSRHKDGDQTNNRSNNLVWGTSQENVHDAVRHGTRIKVMFPDVVDQIIAMDAQGMLRSEIAAHFGVTRPQVTKVLIKHGLKSKRPYKQPEALSPDQIRLVMKLLRDGWSYPRIAAHLGVSRATVWRAIGRSEKLD